MRAVGWIVAHLDTSRDQLFLEQFAQEFSQASSGVASVAARPTTVEFRIVCLKFLEEREPRDGIREHFFDFLVVPSSLSQRNPGQVTKSARDHADLWKESAGAVALPKILRRCARIALTGVWQQSQFVIVRLNHKTYGSRQVTC